MRRAALAAVLVAVTVVLQLTVINRLPLAGAGSPDLVLLVVVALGLCGGPIPGAVTGFCAGLCLDLAPPASQLIGQYALVLCIVGYTCGRLRGTLGRPPRLSLLALICAAAAAVVGEALSAGLSLVLDPAGVSLASVRQALPSSAAYDVVLSPFVLAAIVALTNWAGAGQAQAARDPAQPGGSARRQTAPGGAAAGGTVGLSSGAGLLGGVGWLAGPVSARAARKAAGRTPNLSEKSARSGDGWIGRRPPSWRGAAAGVRAGAPRKLSAAHGVAGSAARSSQGPRPAARPVNLRLGGKRPPGGAAGGQRRIAAAGLPRIGFSAGSGRGGPARPGSGRARWASGQGRPGRGGGSRPARTPDFRYSPSIGLRPGAGRSPSRVRTPSFGRSPGSGRGAVFRQEHGSGPAAGTGLASGAGRLPGRSSSPVFRLASRGGRGPSFKSRSPSTSGLSLRSGPSFRPGSGYPGGSASNGSGGPRAAVAGRPVTLRLRAGRRRDGLVGGGPLSGMLPRRRVFTTSRPAAPRFRGRQPGSGAMTGASAFRSAARSRGKTARIQTGRRSVLPLWTRRRRGGRSAVWRIGSSRTGGMR
jgi:rod shape-determining protein MreD